MKRLLVLTLAVCMVLGAGVTIISTATVTDTEDVVVTWNAYSWIILHIPTWDRAVDLGTIDAGLFNPVTDAWDPITSEGHSVSVATNLASFTLRIEAVLDDYPVGHPDPGGILTRLTLTSAAMGFYDAGLGAILTFVGDGRRQFTDEYIKYAFTPSFYDIPGAYAVTVTYTVTAP